VDRQVELPNRLELLACALGPPTNLTSDRQDHHQRADAASAEWRLRKYRHDGSNAREAAR
jgi:hypothetical protein